MTTITSHEHTLDGVRGRISVHHWQNPQPSFVVLLAHGYGEHAGRYEHVAQALLSAGGTVYAPDHLGHGRSEGEPALIDDIEDVVADLRSVAGLAAGEHPGLPTVLIGHSMGGIIATRYAQQYGSELKALVLSGPAIGGNPALIGLVEMDPIPDVPIDPAILSNDPAVGEAYAADDLVYHGPFKRQTLLAMGGAIETIAGAGSLGDLPTLWLHGEQDQLVPLEHTGPAVENIKGSDLQAKTYPGAQHEIFNETNKDEVIADVIAFLGPKLA
ncbi:Monoacylglycerol lipase [Paraconexibacter sp. AEG42_29]|uniref:Monoacylglycerol lipase n=1 Tax=Paraconexibacter sp. AEG42_29 TaxID=2997339 RepID=A0AAU7B2H0_9ACTN